MGTTQVKPDTIERIRALMDRRGWNQAQAGAYLGVPQGTIGNWLQGTRKPTSAVGRLLDVLGMVEALAPGVHDALTPAKRA